MSNASDFWHSLTEEQKYTLWSTFDNNVYSYPVFCDANDRAYS